MHAITKYKCEICGATYDSQSGAIACENNHGVPQRMISAEYQKFGSNKQYPTSIMIEFRNGEKMRYYRTPGK